MVLVTAIKYLPQSELPKSLWRRVGPVESGLTSFWRVLPWRICHALRGLSRPACPSAPPFGFSGPAASDPSPGGGLGKPGRHSPGCAAHRDAVLPNTPARAGERTRVRYGPAAAGP